MSAQPQTKAKEVMCSNGELMLWYNSICQLSFYLFLNSYINAVLCLDNKTSKGEKVILLQIFKY